MVSMVVYYLLLTSVTKTELMLWISPGLSCALHAVATGLAYIIIPIPILSMEHCLISRPRDITMRTVPETVNRADSKFCCFHWTSKCDKAFNFRA